MAPSPTRPIDLRRSPAAPRAPSALPARSDMVVVGGGLIGSTIGGGSGRVVPSAPVTLIVRTCSMSRVGRNPSSHAVIGRSDGRPSASWMPV